MSWICPKCERELLNEGQRHWCEKISVDSLFNGRSAELVLAFDKILAEVAGWDDVLVSTTPNCIVFVHRKTFLVIRPMQKVIDIKFYSETAQNNPPIIQSIKYGGKYSNNVRLKSADELSPALFKHIYQSYKLL